MDIGEDSGEMSAPVPGSPTSSQPPVPPAEKTSRLTWEADQNGVLRSTYLCLVFHSCARRPRIIRDERLNTDYTDLQIEK